MFLQLGKKRKNTTARSFSVKLARCKVTLADIEQNLHTVILLSNELGGPQVLYDSERQCFGLFADRDYRAGELVTTYGGKEWNLECSGDYVASVNERRHIDGLHDFELQQKARWINEFNSERSIVNVKLGLSIRTLMYLTPNCLASAVSGIQTSIRLEYLLFMRSLTAKILSPYKSGI